MNVTQVQATSLSCFFDVLMVSFDDAIFFDSKFGCVCGFMVNVSLVWVLCLVHICMALWGWVCFCLVP